MNAVYFQNEFGSERAADALAAGATVCDSWKVRNLPLGAILVTLSTKGWWGVYRHGSAGRICRRQSLSAAVRAAAGAA